MKFTDKSPIPILVGPTGSGKSAVGLEMAKALKAEVVSADSRQIYKRLAVGTAKPRGNWRDGRYWVCGVPHHLVDFLEPSQPYNAGLFARQAEELLKTGERFLFVGGTGLYLRALVDGLAPLPPRDETIRIKFHNIVKLNGAQYLHKELVKLDPEAAKKIPANNVARVIRALEVANLTGKPISWWQKNATTPSPRPFLWFGLRWPRQAYESALAKRCRKMLRDGLVEETEALLKSGVPPQSPAFMSLGYPLAIAYVLGKITKDELEKRFIRQTRLYAKRQRTWFNANKRISWLDVKVPFDPEKTAEKLLQLVYNSIRPY